MIVPLDARVSPPSSRRWSSESGKASARRLVARRLDRRRHRSSFGVVFLISGAGSRYSQAVVRDHDLVQAPDRPSWATGQPVRSRSASASSRSSSGSPRSSGARRDAEPRAAHVPLRRARRPRLLRPVHGNEGRLPLHGLRDARRGAQPHLHRSAPLRRNGARPRAAQREPAGARARGRATRSTSSATPPTTPRSRRTRWASASIRTRSASRSPSRRISSFT